MTLRRKVSYGTTSQCRFLVDDMEAHGSTRFQMIIWQLQFFMILLTQLAVQRDSQRDRQEQMQLKINRRE